MSEQIKLSEEEFRNIQMLREELDNKVVEFGNLKLEKLRVKGYSSSDISLSMVNTLKSRHMTEIDERTRIEYMKEISHASLIITKGVDTPLQLTGSIAKLCM